MPVTKHEDILVAVEDRLVRRAANTNVDDLPDDVMEATLLAVFDTLGVAAGGLKAPGVEQVLAAVGELHSLDSPGFAPVPWTKMRVPAGDAALALASMIHAWDFDDTHDVAGIHSCVSSLTAAIVAGARVGASDRRVLEGVVAGVEVSCRLGMALGEVLSTGISRTTACSVFGAAAAAARVLDLGTEGLRSALSIAVSMAGSTRQVVIDGAVTKRLQPAFASRNGLLAAQLAAYGVEGPTGWLRGVAGVRSWAVPSEGFAERLDQGGSERWEVARLSLKPYPACRFTHTAIAAAEEVRRRGSGPLASVRVHLPVGSEHALVARPWSRRGNAIVDAQFSVPWLVAATLIDGTVDLTTLTTSRLHAEDISELAGRVTVIQDIESSQESSGGIRHQTGLPAEVEVMEPNGTEWSAKVATAPGSPESPLGWMEVEQKALACASVSAIPEDAIRSLRKALQGLPDTMDESRVLTTW